MLKFKLILKFISFLLNCLIRIIVQLLRKFLNLLRFIWCDWKWKYKKWLTIHEFTLYYPFNHLLNKCDKSEYIPFDEIPYKFNFAASLILSEVSRERYILAFGCGSGKLVELLSAKGFKVLGIDINPHAIEIAKRLYPNASFQVIETGKVLQGPFSYIFLLDMLEYIERKHIDKLLKELVNELESDGCIIVHTNVNRNNKPDNITLFTTHQLAQIMTNAGLDVILLLKRHCEEEGYSEGLWAMGRKSNKRYRQSGRKVLIAYEARIGDQLCLTPVVAEFRRQNPNDYIAVKVTHPEIYINNPFVDEIVWIETKTKFDVVYRIELPVAPQYRKMTLQDASAMQLGIELPTDRKRPQIFISDLERRIWRERFRRPDGLVIGFAPYSGWPSREWSMSRWRIVVDWLQTEYKATVLYIGDGNRPYPWIGYNLGGLTDVRELALLLEQCDLLLSVDNGVTHMASAVGTPTVAIYGPILAHYRVTVPWIFPIQASECVGCYHSEDWMTPPRTCPLRHHKCMRDITPEQVIEICDNILKNLSSIKEQITQILSNEVIL